MPCPVQPALAPPIVDQALPRAHADVEIVVATLAATPAVTRELAALLSAAEQERAERFAVESERRRYFVARGLLRLLLAERLQIAPEAVEIATLVHGKPVLAAPLVESGLCFNLSHSDECVAYAFTQRRSVGIDIERVRALEDADDIAERMFSSREKEAYSKLGRDERPAGFFHCWTRKEAFIKATGEGLSRPLDSFDVSLSPGQEAELLRVGDVPGHSCGWKLRSFAPGGDLVGAIVVREWPLPAQCRTIHPQSREARH